jgi:hypothetical protein
MGGKPGVDLEDMIEEYDVHEEEVVRISGWSFVFEAV